MNDVIVKDAGRDASLTVPAELIGITEQLVMVVGRLEARLAALEADKSDKVTILHADVNRLNKMIRQRADVIGARYELDTAGIRRIRAAIRKDVLKQYGIRDLHDLPAKRLPTCQLLISNWSSLAAVKAVIGCA